MANKKDSGGDGQTGWFRLFRLLLCLLLTPLPGSAAEQARRILHLDSYHTGYAWSDSIGRGLRQRLDSAGQPSELSVEYLDSRRFTDPALRDRQAELLAAKYAPYQPDLVVVSDNAAFDFAIKHRQRLFPGRPIVFCGYNNLRPEVLAGLDNITGINEEVDLAGTVDLALRVHPATKTLVFITSTGDDSSRRIAAIAEASVFPKYRDRFELIVVKDAPLAEINQKLGQLPADALVFLSGQTSDRGDGRALTPVENARLISAASAVPVYGFWDFQLGNGIVGGRLLTGEDQGRAAADMALQVLAGKAAGDIPVMMTSPTSDLFDFPALDRYKLDPDQLPAGATVLNRPPTLWRDYRWHILGTLALLLLQTTLVAALLRINRQRRRALLALDQERSQLEVRVGERTAALAAGHAVLETILHSLPVGVAVYKASGSCTLVNENYARIAGASRDQLLAQNFREIASWQAAGLTGTALQALADGSLHRRTVHFVSTFGKEIWADSLFLAIQLNNEPHLLVQLFDQSERQRLQDELEQHRQQLEEQVALRTAELSAAKEIAEAANRAKSLFLANMSHEINTPLHGIIGLTSAVRNKLSDPELADKLGRVVGASRDLHAILGNVLDISRLEANRLEIAKTEFTPGALIERIESAVADSFRSKALPFSIDMHALPARLNGDPERLAQMLVNYLSNALKFTETGSVDLLGQVVEDGADDCLVRFEVRDTGIGIAAEHQRRIFLAFEQVDGSYTRTYGGSGLGLGINRALARLMGGEVGVSSTPGQGSCFWLTVRLGKVAA